METDVKGQLGGVGGWGGGEEEAGGGESGVEVCGV